ncbi:MAG: hypothetical protein ACREXK_11440 [Gammaproteobacteria bacterium]
MTFRLQKPQVRFYRPVSPDYLDWLEIRDLRVGDSVLDIRVRRHGYDVSVNVLRKQGDVVIVVIA